MSRDCCDLTGPVTAPSAVIPAGPCGGRLAPVPEYPWQRAYRIAGDYAEHFLAGPLGRQAAAEGWSRRLRSYVQISAWRQLCAGAVAPDVEVPAACVDHWRLCWTHDIREPAGGVDRPPPARALQGGEAICPAPGNPS